MSIIEKAKKFISDKIESFNQTDSGWENRPYDFYLIFGQSEEKLSPWIKSNWDQTFQPYLDLLIKQTQTANESGIRVLKYKPEKRINKKDNKEFIYHSEIKLGRLKWESKTHEKWTIQNLEDNYFLNFELWTPIWTVCEKRKSPPDIFIKIFNERNFEIKSDIQFGYFIVIAIGRNLNIDSKPILKELSQTINAKATVLKTRKWGKPEKFGNWTFVNWIQDTFSNGIYNGQDLQLLDFNEVKFEPEWEIVYRHE